MANCKWTIAKQEACINRGLGSAMGSMLDRASIYYKPKKQAKASVDEIIAKICLGNRI